MSRPIITLLTDFGTSDYYVGALKGVILGINPEAEIIDISHNVLAYDILDAAFTLAQAWSTFPARTVHLVVVDPGVGSQRRPILVSGDRHYFLAPDNGVLSFVYPRLEALTAYHITSEHYFRQPVSPTFHGRDIFAACAAHLSKGVEVEKFGEPIEDYLKLTIPQPKKLNEKAWKGLVLKVDRFGNLITNFSATDCPALFADPTPTFLLRVGSQEVSKLARTYAEGAKGEIFALLGSSGYLEVATNRGGVAKLLAVNRGAEVKLQLS